MARGRKDSTSFLKLKNEATFQERLQLPFLIFIVSPYPCLIQLPTCKGIGVLWSHQSNSPLRTEWVSLLWNPGCMSIRRYLRTEGMYGGRWGTGQAGSHSTCYSYQILPTSQWVFLFQLKAMTCRFSLHHLCLNNSFHKNSFKTHLKTSYRIRRTFIPVP